MYKLVISDDEGRTTVVPLVRDEITIGREGGNTIRLTERNVSRKHARLSRVDERFVLSDAGSHNGVKVNGARLEAELRLASGDQIIIGDYRISFEAEQMATLSDEPEAVRPTARDLVPPARLVMLSQPAPGAEFALNRDVVRIGRDEVMDVWVNHRSVSREHARITRKTQSSDEGEVVSFQIQDLDSANGVRVNGKEVFESALTEGDVLQLGQVSFRYVGLGEVFSFDSGGSAVLAATLTPSEHATDERGRLPIVAAVLILGVAIGLAVAIATSGSGAGGPSPNTAAMEPQSVAEPLAAPSTVAVPANTNPSAAEASMGEAVAAVAACRAGLAAGNLAAAVASAERALVLSPAFSDAEACKAEAAQKLADLELFSRAKAQLEANEIDAAHATMEQLSANSELRASPEFAAAKLAFATLHVRLARAAFADRPEEAAEQAQMVLQTPNIPRSLVTDAQRVLNGARRRMAAGPVAETLPRPAAGAGAGTTEALDAPAPSATGQNAMETARECLSLGDNRCVVAALEGGRAATPAALALLIETYHHMNNHEAARRHMRVFVRRYPTDRRTPSYTATLNR